MESYYFDNIIVQFVIGYFVIKLLVKATIGFLDLLNNGFNFRKQLGNIAFKVPFLRRMYKKEYNKLLDEFKTKAKERWLKFGPLTKAMPKKGWSLDRINQFIDLVSEQTNDPLNNLSMSGTVYSMNNFELRKVTDRSLSNVYSVAYERSYLWNPLHHKEFAVGDWLSYQAVHMVGDMFGANHNEIMGFINSGGSESLMVAIRSYVNWGYTEKGTKEGQAVIIAPDTIHASVIKAEQAYKCKIVLVPTDSRGKVYMRDVEKYVKKYKSRVVALFGSAPNYPNGNVDPIESMALLALRYKIGMHVDCCLGAWIINYSGEFDTNFLDYPGVTSLSADNHKNGQAPKGISTLVTRPMSFNTVGENLARYSIYTVPDWKGGVYGSPKDQGSHPATSLFAFLSMATIGDDEYRAIANKVIQETNELAMRLEEMNFEILTENPINVVAFKLDDKLNLGFGATYAFAYEIQQRGIVLNTLKGDAVHFCVTPNAAQSENFVNNFISLAKESLEAVIEIKKSGEKFKGDAGMYCDLESAIEPKRSSLSIMKYIENYLFGTRMASDALRAHFTALLDPYAK